MQPNISGNFKAYLLLTFTTFCWAMNAVLGKFAIGEISPMTLVCLRWLTVVLLITAIAYRQIVRDWFVLRKQLVFFLLMGGLGFTGFNTLFYLSAYTTTAVNIGILQGSVPVFVLLGGFLAFRSKVSPLQIAGVLITVAGVIYIASGGSLERLSSFTFNPGDLMMVLACALYAGYTVCLRFKPNVGALSFFAMLAFAALLTSLPFAIGEILTGHFSAPTIEGWLVVAVVAIFPSFLAQISFIQGVSMIGPGRAGIFVNLVPVFASILAVTFLGEPFEFYQGAALALVLSGIWLSEKGKVV